MSFLITIFENTLHEVHEDNIGIMYDLELAKKFVQEALLKDNSESVINYFNVGEKDHSYCYTNGNISYTIYELKEIKEVSNLKYGK